MLETTARLLVTLTLAYFAVGLVFAAAFVTRGAGRLDSNAVGGTLGFRLLILPGSAALWPILLTRWVRGTGGRDERSPHRAAARKGATR